MAVANRPVPVVGIHPAAPRPTQDKVVQTGEKTPDPINPDVLAAIAAACPDARNLCGRTDFGQIAELARGAVAAVGNDTGPMHLIAATGCPTLTLFSDESDPARCAPRGRTTTVLRRPALSKLSVDEVTRALSRLRPG